MVSSKLNLNKHIRGRCKTIDTMPPDIKERLERMGDDAVFFIERYEQLQVILKDHCLAIRWLYNTLREYAYQEFTLEEEHLEDSYDPDDVLVPNSVLLTESQTTVEFNWPRTFMQDATVQIGPGNNVQDHAFIQNKDFNILGFLVEGVSATEFKLVPRRAVATPYFAGAATRKLWIGSFAYDAAAMNKVRFQPSSLTPGINTRVVLRARPAEDGL